MTKQIATLTINGTEYRVMQTPDEAGGYGMDADPFLRAARRALGVSVAKVFLGDHHAFEIQDGEATRRAPHEITVSRADGSVIATGMIHYA